MALTQVKALGLAADSIDETKLADDSIDSEHYNDGSIDTAHLADDAVTLAKLASGTDGQIISWDASGNPVAVGPGTDGQVLTSTGAGSPPAFETISTSDTLSYRNRIINGAMEVNQRGNTTSVTGGVDAYYLDRWKATCGGGGGFDVTQATDAPAGLVKSLKVTVTSADSDIQSSNWARVYTKLEGNTTADFAWGISEAKTATVSFWVKSSLTGNFAFAIGNDGQSGYQSYQTQYAISTANTWEKKTITISNATGGTFAVDHTKGICLFWGLKGGSQFNATQNQWNTTDTWFPANSVQVVATNAATWFITGVQFELGSTATDFEYRTYANELLRCQRYYYKITPGGNGDEFAVGYNTNTAMCRPTIQFPVNMRIAPTAIEQSGTATDYMVAHESTETQCNAVPTISSGSPHNMRVVFHTGTVLTSGQGSGGRAYNGSAYLGFSAEL